MHIRTSLLRFSPFLRFSDAGGEGGGGGSATGQAGKGEQDDAGQSGKKDDEDGEAGRRDADEDELLGEPGKKALVRERERAAEAERELAAARARLKEFEDADLTEQQKLERDAQEAREEAATAKADLLRYEVADAKELPAGWAKRLQGSTRQELEADAAQLLEQLGDTRRPSMKPDLSQGRGGGDSKKTGSVASGADLYAERHSAKTK